MAFPLNHQIMPVALGILAAFLALGLVLATVWSVRWWWCRRFREPFYQGVLRPPGWGCLERRQDALFDIAGICAALPLSWAMVAILASLGKGNSWAGGLLVALIATGLYLPHLWRLTRRARTERLGFLGECQVAEHLAILLAEGWRVFHDVPLEVEGSKFNVDHVAVGPGGVVAIETKTISKSRKIIARGDTLRVDGDVVRLPDGSFRCPLKQAKGSARALREWLRSKDVEIAFVQALVILPGWNVSYPKGASDLIRDPRNVVVWLKRLPATFDETSRRRVCSVLEERCRDLSFE